MLRDRFRAAIQSHKRSFWVWLPMIALVLAACIPEGIVIPEAPLLKMLERKSGVIAYVGGDGNIYTSDQGGSNLHAVTTDAEFVRGGASHQYLFPTWSRNSERLAFVSVTQGGNIGFTGGLYTSAPDGQDLIQAHASNSSMPRYLNWSPDSEQVGFVSSGNSGGARLFQVVSAQGDDVQTLDAGAPYYWDWAPDGSGVAVHVGGASRQNRSGARISMLDIGTSVSERGLGLRPTQFQAPAFSPDGTRLLIAIELDTGEDALLLATNSGGVDRVLNLFSGAIGFGWSPDGKKLAYVSGDAFPDTLLGRLTVMDPDNPVEAKTTEEDTVMAFFWSPDNRQIVYFVVTPESFIAQPAPGESALGGDSEIVLQMRIYDVASGSSHEALQFPFVPDPDFLRLLLLFDQYQRSMTIWSPDSQNVVITMFVPVQGGVLPGILVVPASGTLGPRLLEFGRMAVWSWE